MSFRLRLPLPVRRRIAGWHLPDEMTVDIYLRLEADLSERPAERMERTAHPFDGMTYTLKLIDQSNRTYGYAFAFHIKYATDEETLLVIRGGYTRTQL